MEATKQPSPDDLKKMKIYLRYLVVDVPPKEGLKRMSYYTELYDRPGKIYFGLSFRRSEDSDHLEHLLEKGQIIELVKPVVLPYEKDVWLNDVGEVYLLKGYAPWEDEASKPIAKPKVLDPARLAISEIKTRPKPYHELPSQ